MKQQLARLIITIDPSELNQAKWRQLKRPASGARPSDARGDLSANQCAAAALVCCPSAQAIRFNCLIKQRMSAESAAQVEARD